MPRGISAVNSADLQADSETLGHNTSIILMSLKAATKYRFQLIVHCQTTQLKLLAREFQTGS